MKYLIGDKVWRIAQCYPGFPGNKPTGIPYRCFITDIDQDDPNHIWLGSYEDSIPGSRHTGTSASKVHHNLFTLIRNHYRNWILHSPVDVTWSNSSYIDKWRKD